MMILAATTPNAQHAFNSLESELERLHATGIGRSEAAIMADMTALITCAFVPRPLPST
jgi:hypothetical protein